MTKNNFRSSENGLIQDIMSFRAELEEIDYVKEDKRFFTVMDDFWFFLTRNNGFEPLSVLENDCSFHGNKKFFRTMENYRGRAAETMDALSAVINSRKFGYFSIDDFAHTFHKDSYLTVGDELEMVDLSRCKELVMIGCGSLSETIFYMLEHTDIKKITGLDWNQEAVFLAGEVMSFVDNKSRANFIFSDPVEFDYGGADVILVSNFTSNKNKVLDRIAETANSDAKILARNPVLFGRLFFDDFLGNLGSDLRIIRRGAVKKHLLGEMILLEKI